ncbi:hypothetical protein [Nocardia brasiliensis]|uniref:hypothetical protein n=1 Tax=Nocardia brasiliensis TaxID=37326 RepID=UPI002453B2A3|nr:hypothetical protein [Nocardia brasiliensis]
MRGKFTALWLVLGAALLVLVVAAMRRAVDFPPLALGINAVFTLLLSPPTPPPPPSSPLAPTRGALGFYGYH